MTRSASKSTVKPRLDHSHVRALLKGMIRIRRFEGKCAELYTQQKIRGFLHLYDGEEAVAVGVMTALDARDRVVATYREHGHALARSVPMTTTLAEMYGKAEGCAGGRGGSMHLFDAAQNFYGGNLRAKVDQTGTQHPILEHLDLDRTLLGLHDRDDIASGHLFAGFLQPLDQRSRLHIGAK